jgi:hypothetical protein
MRFNHEYAKAGTMAFDRGRNSPRLLLVIELTKIVRKV